MKSLGTAREGRFLWLALVGAVAASLFCHSSCTTKRFIKASVISTTLEATSYSQWVRDLSYQEPNIHPLLFPDALGCPFVEVEAAGVNLALMLDSGTARGLLITNHAPRFPYRVGSRGEELNADGSHRGESLSIRIDAISILGASYKNVAATLSDWRMFSSEAFDGTFGLEFFLDRRLTLDYRSKRVGVSTSPLPERLDAKRYLTIDLVEPPKQQGRLLYARARVNRRDAIVYFDTGYNVSFIDPSFVEGLARIVRPGKFSVFRQMVPMELDGHTFLIDNLRESPIRRGGGFDVPVALTLGSDFLANFIVTIDLRAKKLILASAR